MDFSHSTLKSADEDAIFFKAPSEDFASEIGAPSTAYAVPLPLKISQAKSGRLINRLHTYGQNHLFTLNYYLLPRVSHASPNPLF